jgi:Lipocalin-like domain
LSFSNNYVKKTFNFETFSNLRFVYLLKFKTMKKLILLFAIVVLASSCKSTAPIVSNSIDMRSQVAIKGNWSIVSVTYVGSEMFPISPFEIADSKCFEGSNWNFVSNNDSGDMTLTKSSCKAFTSPIKWYVNKEGQFVLKFLNEGIKAKNTTQGYILEVADQTKESFKLIDNIKIGGKMTEIVYSFRKN